MRDVWRFANTKFVCVYTAEPGGMNAKISANIDREVELRVDGLWNKMNFPARINRPICL